MAILDALVEIVLRHVEGCVVEIGSGDSTHVLGKYAYEKDTLFYTCDINPDKVRKPFFDKHKHFLMSSFEFMEEFDDSPAVVFLDGDHNYNVVSTEFEFFFDKLAVGGVIFIHDTLPPNTEHLVPGSCSDSYRLRQELEKQYDNLGCFTWPYTAGACGLTMVIKKATDRPYFKQ